MPLITLVTEINADIEICFDLSRSIDLHKISTSKTNEIAVDGISSGLIGLNEFVTWQATHFGVRQNLTSKITAYNRPYHFRDEQIKGAFKSFQHDHFFEKSEKKVIMKDVFDFESPFGILGEIVNRIILKSYMTQLLKERNAIIKEFAETDKWRAIFPNS